MYLSVRWLCYETVRYGCTKLYAEITNLTEEFYLKQSLYHENVIKTEFLLAKIMHKCR
jgi:hypothetical protein